MRWWQCRWQWRNTLKWSRGRMWRKWRLSCLSPSQTSSPPDTPSVLLFIFSCFAFAILFTGISPSLLTAESFLFNEALKSSNCPICKCVFVRVCLCANTFVFVCHNVSICVCVNVLYKVIHGTFFLQILPLFRSKTLRNHAIFQDFKTPLPASVSFER